MFSNLMNRVQKAGREAGFTIAETTTVLTAAAILAAAAAPSVSNYIESARTIRAKSDLKVLGSAIQMYRVDTAEYGFLKRGKAGLGIKDSNNAVTLLVGNGDTPGIGPGGDPSWALPVNGLDVDFFEDHLVTNTAGYVTSEGRTSGFAQASQGRHNAVFAWRGPYVNGPIEPDPWGNRYACNVVHLSPTTGFDVVILSAGPDEMINTDFSRDGITPGGDDLMFIVSGGR